MSKEILAKVAGIYNDGYCTTVSFANDPDNPTDYLILQATNYPSKQDIDLGQDGIHMQINDQQNGGYNYINSIIIADRLIYINLFADVSEKQKIEQEIVIKLLTPEEDIKTIKAGLEAMIRRLKAIS